MMTDTAALGLIPVAEELVTAVEERDPDLVEAVFGFADARALAVVLADLVVDAREKQVLANERRKRDVKDARKNANPDADDFAQLLRMLRDRDRRIEELNKRVWGNVRGVQPVGMSLERAEEIAAEAAERGTHDSRD